MRAIFEHVDGMDYLEVVLSPEDLDKLNEKNGIAKEFHKNSLTKFNLNIYIRKEHEYEVDNALEERKKQKSNLTQYYGNGARRISAKASGGSITNQRPQDRK